MRAIGCYIFAGGFALGVKNAGFEIIAHLEQGNYGVETFKLNFPKVPVWQHPVTWPLRYLRQQEPDFIYCNPPCAAWSMAGKSLTGGKTSWLTDGRVNCVKQVFRVLEEVRPTVLVWESVTQAFRRARALIKQLTQQANDLGYAVTYLFTSAAHHGLPQPRERFMMFCSKVELQFPFEPVPRRNVQDCLEIRQVNGGWEQGCPVWGVPPMSPSYYALARATGPGESLRDIWDELVGGDVDPLPWEAQSPAFMAHRLQLDGAGHTFTSAVMEVHPIWTRWIANSEIGRMCGYPDNYRWAGDTQLIRAQMCQAVLPPVGQYAGSRVLAGLRAGVSVSGRTPTRLINHLERNFL